MNKPVLENLSKYYQSIISRINTPELKANGFDQHQLDKDLITAYGTIIYNVNQRGFYGIVDDNGTQYYPVNEKQFSQRFKDRVRIKFSLRLHPEISNLYRWGTTANVVAIQLIE